jgi:hypothetical protein
MAARKRIRSSISDHDASSGKSRTVSNTSSFVDMMKRYGKTLGYQDRRTDFLCFLTLTWISWLSSFTPLGLLMWAFFMTSPETVEKCYSPDLIKQQKVGILCVRVVGNPA